MRHFLCSLLTGCFSVCIFGGFVFMWFSSGGRCLYYRTKFLHTLDWYGLSYVSSLVHSEGWLTASPNDSRDLTSGIRHSIKQFLSCVCLMCSELDLLLRPPPLPTSEWRYFLVLSFRSLNREGSLMWILVWDVSGDSYNSEFCDLNGEVTGVKCFPMFFRPAHQCELKFRGGPPD